MVEETGNPRTDLLAVGLVEKACQEAGCTVNRAYDDQHGWDLIVEYPVPTHSGPADTRPPALKCFVQVKSTVQSDKSSVTIKLSNALKLARNPLPCFTALVLYADDGKTPTGMYLQHFDKPQIAQALKAARQAHVDDETALNHKYVTLHFAPVEMTPAETLAKRMTAAVPTPGTYGAAKDRYANDVGYEDGYAKGKLSLAREHVGIFIEALLGKDVAVPIENMAVREQRFGIVNPKALFDSSGTLQVTPQPFKTCRVVVRHPATGEQIILPGDIFVPGIPDLPEEYHKMRVRTDLLEFTCGRGEGRNVAFGDFTASFGTEERTSIDRIDQLAALWSWLGAGALEIGLWVDGMRFLHGQIEAKTEQSEGYWKALRYVTKTLAGFVDKELRPVEMQFSLSDFFDLSKLLEFCGLIDGAGMTVNVSTELDVFPTDVQNYITPIFLEFGAVLFFAVGRYRIKNGLVGDSKLKIELIDPVIQRRAVLAGTLANNAEFAREETLAAEKECAAAGEYVVASFLPEALADSSNTNPESN